MPTTGMMLGFLVLLFGLGFGAALTPSKRKISIPRPSRPKRRGATVVLPENRQAPYRLPVDWVGAAGGMIIMFVGLYMMFAGVGS